MLLLTGFRVRQAIKKQKGGGMSVPVTRTNRKIKLIIKERITEISKLAINNEGEVVQRNKCSGQKNPFRGDKRGFDEKQSSTKSQG